MGPAISALVRGPGGIFSSVFNKQIQMMVKMSIKT